MAWEHFFPWGKETASFRLPFSRHIYFLSPSFLSPAGSRSEPRNYVSSTPASRRRWTEETVSLKPSLSQPPPSHLYCKVQYECLSPSEKSTLPIIVNTFARNNFRLLNRPPFLQANCPIKKPPFPFWHQGKIPFPRMLYSRV